MYMYSEIRFPDIWKLCIGTGLTNQFKCPVFKFPLLVFYQLVPIWPIMIRTGRNNPHLNKHLHVKHLKLLIYSVYVNNIIHSNIMLPWWLSFHYHLIMSHQLRQSSAAYKERQANFLCRFTLGYYLPWSMVFSTIAQY